MPTALQKIPASSRRHRLPLGRAPYLIRRDIRNSVREGSAHSIMAGLGENYFPAFALAVGLGEVNSGLLATVPLLVGALAQLVSPAAVRHLGSYRRWVVLCASIQCFSFVPFIIAAMIGKIPPSAAFLFAGVYWGSGLSIGAAWNTWIGSVVPSPFRTQFFSLRNRFVQTAGMVGFLLGGLVLHFQEKGAHQTLGFAGVFAIAFIARGISIFFLSKVSEPVPPKKNACKSISFFEFAQTFKKGDEGGKLLLYLLSVQLTVFIASPFFTPFMLSQLKLNYPQFAALIAATFAAKIIALPTLGRLVSKNGAAQVLWFGGLGIAINPALWLISSNFWFLLFIQSLSGLFWAAFELCTVLMLIDRIEETKRVGLLTNYNLVNAGVMVLGSMIGATLLDTLGKTVSSYYILFTVSFVARAGTLYLLNKVTVSRKLKWFALPSYSDFRRTTELIFVPQLPRVFHRRRPAKRKKAA